MRSIINPPILLCVKHRAFTGTIIELFLISNYVLQGFILPSSSSFFSSKFNIPLRYFQIHLRLYYESIFEKDFCNCSICFLFNRFISENVLPFSVSTNK